MQRDEGARARLHDKRLHDGDPKQSKLAQNSPRTYKSFRKHATQTVGPIEIISTITHSHKRDENRPVLVFP